MLWNDTNQYGIKDLIFKVFFSYNNLGDNGEKTFTGTNFIFNNSN
jgi:hypothetical protein